ncbi:MAG: hydrogenase maturation protease [Bryobacteraceae bacterium]|jgi:hydrogenase maturation protease
MPRLLIVGYGNRLRGDDGAGYRAAELLREGWSSPDVEILAVEQLTPELMEPIGRAREVIFIDAAADGQPGEIRECPVVLLEAGATFTHHATPAALLAGAVALYGATASGVLYSIGGESFELGERLTPAVERAVAELVSRLAR